MADEYIRKADAVSIAESYEVKRDGFHLNDYEYGRNQVADSIASDLEDMPPADVAPVVHGRWMPQKGGGLCCSECGGYALDEPDGNFIHVATPSKFCPYCGAKMDGEE